MNHNQDTWQRAADYMRYRHDGYGVLHRSRIIDEYSGKCLLEYDVPHGTGEISQIVIHEYYTGWSLMNKFEIGCDHFFRHLKKIF